MKIKKILAAILGCAVCLSAFTACGGNSQSLSAIKKSGKMVMYTNAAFPPFEYKDSSGVNGVAGVDVDIAKEIAKDIGVELEIQDIEFTSALAAVQNGKGAVAIAGIMTSAASIAAIVSNNATLAAEAGISSSSER